MLEQAIQELTVAVRDLTAKIGTLSSPTVQQAAKEVVAKTIDTVKQEIKAIDAQIEQDDSALKDEVVTRALSYDDVKKATIALSAKNKASAVELLSSFGVQKATQLTEDQWAEYVTAAENAIAGL